MSGPGLQPRSVLVDNVGWQQQLASLSAADSVFTLIFLHKKASADLRLILETQLVRLLPPGRYCLLNCCNHRLATAFGTRNQTCTRWVMMFRIRNTIFGENIPI